MADSDIVFRIRAEGTDKFIKDLKQAGVVVEDTGDKVEKSNKNMESSFTKLGKTIGAAFTVGAIIQFTKVLAKAAVDIDATNAKIQTVFGQSTKEVEKFAKANATALGLTVNEYKRAAAAIGDLLVPIGFQRKEAAKLSNDLVKLSGALSAWTGGQLNASEVSQILTKALLGEREQLKTLGIQISEADVKARLLEKGQKNLTGATLAQAKATATLELITEKSADAQAAFADDTTTLAEAQAQFSANVRELRDRLAEGLIPALTDLISFLNDGIKAWNRFNDRITGQDTIDAFGESVSVLDDYALAVERLGLVLQKNTLETQDNIIATKDLQEVNAKIAEIDEEIARRKAAKIEIIKEEGDAENNSLKALKEQLKEQQKIVQESAKFSEEQIAAQLEVIRLQKEIKKVEQFLKDLSKPAEDFAFIFTDALAGIPSQINAIAGAIASNLEPVLLDTAQKITDGLAIPQNFEQIATDAAKKQADARKEFAQKEAEETKQIRLNQAQQGLAGISQLQQGFAQAFAGFQQAELQALQNKYDQGLISEKEFQEQRSEILSKQAKTDKANAIFSATIGAAAAIVQALNSPPPASFVFAALAGSIAAAQIAAIAAQPIPQFAEGTKGRKRAPSGFAWVGEEGPELMQMRGGEKIITNQDSEELMRLMAGYGIPVQFNTLEKELYKPMTKMEALITSKQAPLDLNPLVRSNDMNRFSLGKKLDRIHEAIVTTNTRKMTRS